MKATLSLTHDCNLACRYCYAGRKFTRGMSWETAHHVIDFVFGLTQLRQPIDFSFFGGEPLLRMDTLAESVRYIRARQQATGQPVVIGVTCNGTLLTPQVRAFLRSEQVDVCVSIDGPPHVHDLNRRRRDGAGSFSEVAENLQAALAELNSIQINAVYGPDTLAYLPETVDFFAAFGVRVMHLNPNIRATWESDAAARLGDVYREVADRYIDHYRSGHEIAVNMIDSKIILFLKGGYAREDMCGMGESEWAFAPSGNIYPCERFIGEDDDASFCLGNVFSGIDPRRRCAISARRGNRNVECVGCSWSKFCMNWCGCANHAFTGSTDLAGPFLCASERAALSAARHALSTLTAENNMLFLSHCMGYLSSGRDCSKLR